MMFHHGEWRATEAKPRCFELPRKKRVVTETKRARSEFLIEARHTFQHAPMKRHVAADHFREPAVLESLRRGEIRTRAAGHPGTLEMQIGRASCRERV